MRYQPVENWENEDPRHPAPGEKRLWLAIDGGATKTLCAAGDDEGHVLGIGRGGPSNPFGADRETAVRSLRQAAEEASAQAGCNTFDIAYLGVAGHITGDSMYREAIHARRILVSGDVYSAFIGATMGHPGVAVVAGTGSSGVGRNARGESATCGGWGPLMGDEGSGYDVGVQALRAVALALDDRGPWTSLVKRIGAHPIFDGADEEFPEFWSRALDTDVRDYTTHALLRRLEPHARQKNAVADLSRLVFCAAAEGDAVAQGILRDAGSALSDLAMALIRRLDMAGEEIIVATVGGMFERESPLLETFRCRVGEVAPRASIGPPLNPPVVGSALLCLEHLGVDWRGEISDRVADGIRARM